MSLALRAIAATGDGCSSGSLREQMDTIARATNGPVGAAIMIVEDGEIISFHGRQRFPMQSVYKLPIAMAVLHAVDAGQLSLDRKIRVSVDDLVPPPLHSPIRDEHPDGGIDTSVDDLLRSMIVESDGTASDVLMRLLSGPLQVGDYVRQLGVTEMEIATTERAMAEDEDVQYRNWATPEGTVKLLGLLQKGKGLLDASRGLLLQLMTETDSGPHRIKGSLPPGTAVAHKTGSSGTVDGITRATNDIGLITLPDGRHLAVAVFVSDTKADETTRDSIIAKIARAGYDCHVREKEVKP